jgi:hypothetical protein
MTSRAWTRLLCCLLMLGTFLYPQEKKRKSPKPPDLTIVDVKVHRDGDVVSLDGHVKNTSEKPLAGVVLLIDFFGPNKDPLTTQRGTLENELLEPGQEADFRLEIKAPARAVEVRFNSQDKNTKDLRVENSGPFAID